ncbi:hypothetical protein D3C85_838080 [compost metagenome]
MHGQFTAAAQAEAIDGGDQRLAETGDALPVGQARVIEDADQVALGHFLYIGAGGEGLAAAGDHHHAGLGVLFGGVQFGGQLTQQFRIEGVERLRALQGDQADTLLGRQDGKGTRHVDCPQVHARLMSAALIGWFGEAPSCVARHGGRGDFGRSIRIKRYKTTITDMIYVSQMVVCYYQSAACQSC